jgi:YVTN family beta-propeller protein
MIGPFRGGRTVGAVGVPGQPNVFYIGVNNGGVWKTTDAGRTWTPLFDDQPTGSVGTVAVAPSNPNVLYVGSGEGLQRPDLSTGDGVYKSIDGGKTWKNIELHDGQQIPAILVDPHDPDRLFVAVLGHPYGANAERGVFRSTNGGQTWQKILYKDENTGAAALAFDPTNAQTVYAVLWSSRQGPWENGAWQGPGSGLYKSTDGGTTWRQLTQGLPTPEQGLGRIGIAVAPSDPRCLYAVVDARQLGGVYRSDDAGESWRRVHTQRRVWGRGSDFAEVRIDPRDKEVVFVANTSVYRSSDGGQAFTAFKGAPGGDDYHTIWINPTDPQIMLLASDQGAVVTVNGGQTWSSWYNQPTAQFYHVITDNQFPYWVYGGQQESGSAGVASRGRDGQITCRDWYPVGVEEYGYVAPDPLNANLIYGGKVSRFDRTTGQVQEVGPEAVRSGKYRFLRTAPLLFSPVDPHVLYLGANVLFKTADGGKHWEVISPDLSRAAPEVPENIGVFRTPALARQPRRGVIYTVAPSYRDAQTIWAGTDDGLIHVTRDGGKTWTDVTPPGVSSWSKVSLIDAGRFDAATAYAAVNRIRLDDQRPHIYRTHDGGKSWQETVRGLPDNAPVNVVREDPVRKGLLFAGTERAVFVSFNDGDDWQPLRLNMPATSIRDLVIHDDDVVVGTHGRSFWILDDITPLRQIDARVAAAEAHLFRPQVAYRVRWNVNTDTPLPPEEPAGQNPPDGAIINYYLKQAAAGPVTLEILDSQGRLVRRYTSTDKPEPVVEKDLVIPTYWIRPPQTLSAEAGQHRFVWDLHYPPPEGRRRSYPMAAIYRNTPSAPSGPAVLPGQYTVRLAVGGRSLTQPLMVKMDPRVKTPPEGLTQQFALSMKCYEGMREVRQTLDQIRKVRAQWKDLRERAGQGPRAEALAALDQKAAALEGPPRGPGRRGRGDAGEPSLSRLQGQMAALLELLQGADASPSPQAVAAAAELDRSLSRLRARWKALESQQVTSLPAEQAKAKTGPKLYVTNSEGDHIHVIDLQTLQVIGRIKTGDRPHGAAASADGRRFFTTVESDHSLRVIDTATDRIIKSVPLTGMPNQCAVTPDGRFVGVPIRDGDSVDVIDVAQGKVVKNLPVKVPHNCYNAHHNDHIFVTSMGAHLVKLIDLKTLSYLAEIPVGGVPRPLAVTRDEKTLYCALSDLHGFVIADIAARKVVRKVELPLLPAGTKFPVPHTPTHGLELTPDEMELWVTSCGTDTVYVYDTASGKITGKVAVGCGPNWVTFSPDGKYCCVSNVLSDDVSILDVAGRKEVARVKVGKQPKRLVAVKVP